MWSQSVRGMKYEWGMNEIWMKYECGGNGCIFMDGGKLQLNAVDMEREHGHWIQKDIESG